MDTRRDNPTGRTARPLRDACRLRAVRGWTVCSRCTPCRGLDTTATLTMPDFKTIPGDTLWREALRFSGVRALTVPTGREGMRRVEELIPDLLPTLLAAWRLLLNRV